MSSAILVVLLVGTGVSLAAEPAATNAPSNDLLLRGTLGELVVVPTNQVPRQLLPPAGTSVTNQIPEPFRGTLTPESVRQREQNQRAGKEGLQFFPSYKMPLASYLQAQDDLGNTALKPGALVPWTPVDVIAQRAK